MQHNDSVLEGNNENSGGGESNVEEDAEATRTTDGRFRAVARALIRLASEAFARGKRYLMNDTTTTATDGDSDNGGGSDGSSTSGETEADATSDDGPFRRFDISPCPVDHHFLDSMEQVIIHIIID